MKSYLICAGLGTLLGVGLAVAGNFSWTVPEGLGMVAVGLVLVAVASGLWGKR